MLGVDVFSGYSVEEILWIVEISAGIDVLDHPSFSVSEVTL